MRPGHIATLVTHDASNQAPYAHSALSKLLIGVLLTRCHPRATDRLELDGSTLRVYWAEEADFDDFGWEWEE